MNLFRTLIRPNEARSYWTGNLTQLLAQLSSEGVDWPVLRQTLINERVEDPDPNYLGFSGLMKRNSVVFACMALRRAVFSQAQFKFRNLATGKLFGSPALAILEHPWTNATTGDLLARAILDVDLAGNSFWARHGATVRRLRPDWVQIIMGSETDVDVTAWDFDADVLGYVYQPGGPNGGEPREFFLAEQVAHFAPYPDPLSPFRGMSWLETVLPETKADNAANVHKARFFENGATVNLVVTLDPTLRGSQFDEWVDKFEAAHKGGRNAYKTLYLGAGAKVEPMGSNFEQMQLKVTQGAGETRVAAAAGVPPILVGLSEGLQAATYNNYPAARRRFADGTITDLLANFCGSFETIVTTPPGAQLWFDPSRIPFFREDVKDAAEIVKTNAATIGALINNGFEPDAAIEAVIAGELSELVGTHTGLPSVQLQPPPAALPSGTAPAEPAQIPATTEAASLRDLRCPGCKRLVGRVAGSAEIKCRGCGTLVAA